MDKVSSVLVVFIACVVSNAICTSLPPVTYLSGKPILGASYSLAAQSFDNTSPILGKNWALWTAVQWREDEFPTQPTSYILSYYQKNSSKTGLHWYNGTAVPLYDCVISSSPSGAGFVAKGSGSSSSRMYVGCFQSSTTKPHNIAWEYDITNDYLRTFQQFTVKYVSALTQFVGLTSDPGFVYALGEYSSGSIYTILKFDLATLTLQNYTQMQSHGSYVATYLVTDNNYLYLSTGYNYDLAQLLIYDTDLNLVSNITQTNIAMFGPGSFASLQSMMIFFGRNSTDFPNNQNGVFIGVDTNTMNITKLYGLPKTLSTASLPGYACAVDESSTNFYGIFGNGVIQLDINSFTPVAESTSIYFPPYTVKDSPYAYAEASLLTPIPSSILHTSSIAPTILVGSTAFYTNTTLFVTPVVPV